MTEGRSQRTTPPTADWLLGSLVALANSVEDQGARVGIPVTLNVGGFIVSGLMISGKEYFEIFSQIMEEGLPEALFGEEGKEGITSMYRDFGDLYGPEGDDPDPISRVERYNFVHLREATFLHTSGDPIPTKQGMLWRTRLRAVDGFTLGSIVVTDPDSDESDDDESAPQHDR